jgi:hypothetical protein
MCEIRTPPTLSGPNLISGSRYRVSRRPTYAADSFPHNATRTRRIDFDGLNGRPVGNSARTISTGCSGDAALRTSAIVNVRGPDMRSSAFIWSLFGAIVSVISMSDRHLGSRGSQFGSASSLSKK